LGEGEKIKVKSRKNKQHFSVLKAVTDMAIKKWILAGIIPGSPTQQIRKLPTDLPQIAYQRFLLQCLQYKSVRVWVAQSV
jgi:hypothetical protein